MKLASIFSILAFVILTFSQSGYGSECSNPDDVPCPDTWNVECTEETVLTPRYYKRGAIKCFACPVCVGSVCPNIPYSYIMLPDGCDYKNTEFYDFYVDIDDVPCYTGLTYKCKKAAPPS